MNVITYQEGNGVTLITPVDLTSAALISQLESQGYAPYVIDTANMPTTKYRDIWKYSPDHASIVLEQVDLYPAVYDKYTINTDNMIVTGFFRYYVVNPITTAGMTLWDPASAQDPSIPTYIDFSTDMINQNNMMAVMLRILTGMIVYPYILWQDTEGIKMQNSTQLTSFLVGFTNHIEDIRRTRAAYRATFSSMTVDQLLAVDA